jgi:hypothetical protein
MAYRQSSMTPVRDDTGLSRRTTAGSMTPHRAWQRIADEMDRLISDFHQEPQTRDHRSRKEVTLRPIVRRSR